MAPRKPSDPTFASQVEQALLRVPSGRVVTYGGLALLGWTPPGSEGGGDAHGPQPLWGTIALPSGGIRLGGAVQPGRSGRNRHSGSGPKGFRWKISVWISAGMAGMESAKNKGGELCVQVG